MKTFYKYFLSGICLSIASVSAVAESETIIISMNDGREIKDLPSKGARKPPVSIICTIDFEKHSIATSIQFDITGYELWDEDGVYPIASYDTDSEFVDFLSEQSGVYQLRLVGEEHAYIGYIEL